MFDFNGTFSREEFNKFIEYLDKLNEDTMLRIIHLTAEISRVDILIFKISEAEKNFNLDTKISEPYNYYMLDSKGNWTETLNDFDSGTNKINNDLFQIHRSVQDDADVQVLMDEIKIPFKKNIKRLERVEYKLKKALDLKDQLEKEKESLENLQSGYSEKKNELIQAVNNPNHEYHITNDLDYLRNLTRLPAHMEYE